MHAFAQSCEALTVGHFVSEPRVLSPAHFPRCLAPGHDEELAAADDASWRSFVSGQHATEPHDRRVWADEGQFLEQLTLSAVPEHSLVHCGMTLLDHALGPIAECPGEVAGQEVAVRGHAVDALHRRRVGDHAGRSVALERLEQARGCPIGQPFLLEVPRRSEEERFIGDADEARRQLLDGVV